MRIVLSEVQLNDSWISHLTIKIPVMWPTKFWSKIIDILYKKTHAYCVGLQREAAE